MQTQVSKDKPYGDEILSIQQLSKKVGRLTWGVSIIGALLVAGTLINAAGSFDANKPMLLDSSTGNIITDYSHVLEGYTVEERKLYAKLAYEGLRRRTGIAAVDGRSLEDWSNNITQNGLNTWKNLGPRWVNPHFVQPGFSRTIQVLAVKPDKKNEYAFTIESIESEAEVGKHLSNKQFRVRLTLFFTDPKVHGFSKIDSVDLHEEELLK